MSYANVNEACDELETCIRFIDSEDLNNVVTMLRQALSKFHAEARD